MNIQEIITNAQVGTETQVFKFDVKAWSTDEKPFTIHHRPFTIADVSWVEKQSKGVKSDSLVYTVIRKALDSEGKKIFTLADHNFLRRSVKSNIIVGIVNKLNEIDLQDDYAKE